MMWLCWGASGPINEMHQMRCMAFSGFLSQGRERRVVQSHPAVDS